MKNVLVTGGAGFIGSNFIHYMLEKYDYHIINYDSLTYAGNIANLKSVENHINYTFVNGDIRNSEEIQDVFTKYNIDIVVNFAAETHVDNSINNPSIFVETNVLGTQNLLEISKKAWAIGRDEFGYPTYRDGVKFMQVSTDEVYGSLGKTGFFTENSPIQPNSPYSASKASADHMVRAYNKTFKLPANISRCSNNYGPYQNPEKLIPLMIMNTINNKKLPVYGDGQQIRDWLYVEDHCSAIDVVIHHGLDGEVYNIGGNNEKANIEIVKLILNQMEADESLINYVQDRLGHDRRYAIDNTKITSQLGWKPSYTFEEGIHTTIEWYLKNKEWLILSSEFGN